MSSLLSFSARFPPPTIAQLYARALYDPRPTKTLMSQKQLAYALGYPLEWRVERNVVEEAGEEEEEEEVTTSTPITKKKKKTVIIIKDRIHALGGGGGGGGGKKKNHTKIYMWLNHGAAQKAAVRYMAEGTLEPPQHHSEEGTSTGTGTTGGVASLPSSSSHLLPAKALYAKNESVQVLYEDNWWSATVTKKPKKKNDDEYLYSVYYAGDHSYQDDVEETLLRPGESPSELAATMLGVAVNSTNNISGWSAVRKGSRYVLTSPDGYIFHSKQKALKYYRELVSKSSSSNNHDQETSTTSTTTTSSTKKKRRRKRKNESQDDCDGGSGGSNKKTTMDGNAANDPPWRMEGHPLIGRRMMWTYQHQASARRTTKIEQVGTIEGYIDEADIDKAGKPGFFSEKYGQPAHLFQIVFDADPTHPYSHHLLRTIDLEEYEFVDHLLVPPVTPKAKAPVVVAADVAAGTIDEA